MEVSWKSEMPLPALRKKARCMAFCGTGGGMSLLNTYPKTALGLYKVSFFVLMPFFVPIFWISGDLRRKSL